MGSISFMHMSKKMVSTQEAQAMCRENEWERAREENNIQKDINRNDCTNFYTDRSWLFLKRKAVISLRVFCCIFYFGKPLNMYMCIIHASHVFHPNYDKMEIRTVYVNIQQKAYNSFWPYSHRKSNRCGRWFSV